MAAPTRTRLTHSNVGKVVESTISSLTNFGVSSGNWFDLTSILLPANTTWEIEGQVLFQQNGSSGTQYIGALINSTSGNNTTGTTFGKEQVNATQVPNSVADALVQVLPFRISVGSSDTTYYLKGIINFSAGTPRFRCNLKAVQVF